MSNNILDLDPHCSAAYTLLSNIYASAGRWSDISRVTHMKMRKNVKEGYNWLNQQVRGVLTYLDSWDRSIILNISRKAQPFGSKLHEYDYSSDKKFGLHEIAAGSTITLWWGSIRNVFLQIVLHLKVIYIQFDFLTGILQTCPCSYYCLLHSLWLGVELFTSIVKGELTLLKNLES